MRRLSRTKTFAAKPDLVSTTLIYPMTLTTDDFSTFGLQIIGNASAPLGQQVFNIQTSAGANRYVIGVAGGANCINCDTRVYHAAGGSYAAFNATAAIPCIELPDGTGQGSKIWSGSGVPGASTVGAATVGDYYLRRYNTQAAPTLIAQSASTQNATNTAITCGSGTPGSNITHNLAAAPAVGDLLIVVAENTVAAETCTIGADTGITDGAGDGGVLYNDGTRRIHVFSHVVQAGDISGNNVTASALANNAGSNRRLFAYLYRAEWGFPTTGSKHGCPITSDDNADTAVTAQTTRTVTGPSVPSVSVAAAYGGANSPPSPFTFYWDAGSAADKSADTASGSNGVSGKPGLGTNTSGATGYTTGGSSCQITNQTANTGTVLGNWAANTTPPLTNTLYVCTVGGSPGTWIPVY